MTRRSLLGAAAVGLIRTGAQNISVPLVKPPVLRPGDVIGLITPASYVADPDKLTMAERTIRALGFTPKFGRNVGKRTGYLAGTAGERLDDLHAMFRDPEVRAVMPLRGGYGTEHLLDYIDYDLIRRNPKFFCGYSDITAMHIAIQKRIGMVTFHGPMFASSAFTPYTMEHFRPALFEAKPLGVLTYPSDPKAVRPSRVLRTIRRGRARGPLVGGNLSIICALMGTPYEIDARGRILFLEDVSEQPYTIDRMLTQLRLAGKLQGAAGIVWGDCRGCGSREFQPSFDSTYSIGEVVETILGSIGVPVLYGLPIGHSDDQLTLPVGVPATLDADQGTLTVEESATLERS